MSEENKREDSKREVSKREDNKRRDRYYKQKYGISLKEYNKKLKQQLNSCALCEKHESNFTMRLAVDHNHKTGKVRGLLCYRCNKFIVGRHNKESATRLYNYMLRYEVE